MVHVLTLGHYGHTGLYLYLWHHLHWWGIPVYMACITAIGSLKAFLSWLFTR